MNVLHLLPLFALLAGQARAFTNLHHAVSSGASPTILRGRTLITLPDNLDATAFLATPFVAAPPPPPNQGVRMLEFSAELTRDVVIFDELQENSVSIESCSRSAPQKKASITLNGAVLDVSDFQPGTAFAINVEDWETNCGQVQPVEGVDDSDDVLFYTIDGVSSAHQSVTLQMSIVPGSQVVPRVDVQISDELPSLVTLPKSVVLDDGPLFAATDSLLFSVRNSAVNQTLPFISRPTISHTMNVQVAPGAQLELDASISASLYKISLRRFYKTEFRWTQSFKAHLDAHFVADLGISGERSGSVFSRPIPKIGFSKKIWLVGRVRLGAFAKVDWVLDAQLDAGLEAEFSSAYHLKQRVTAQLIPLRYKAKNLLPANSGSTGRASLNFLNREGENGIRGFVGVRPALAVMLKFGSRGLEGNVGAKLGLQAHTTIKKPPFQPFTGRGLKIGSCDICHNLRGSLSIKGKELSLKLLKNGRVKKNQTLVAHLFTIELGTVCALPDAFCGNSLTCRRCSSVDMCPSGYTCLDGECVRLRLPGQPCRRCDRCTTGMCVNHVCFRSAHLGSSNTITNIHDIGPRVFTLQ